MKKRFLNLEFAGIHNDPYLYGSVPSFGKLRISSKDRLLVEKGGTSADTYDIYLDLLTDSHVFSIFDRQANEITSRNWFLEVGGDKPQDQEALEFVQEVLTNLSVNSKDTLLSSSSQLWAVESNSVGLDGLTRALCLSQILGISIAEIIWTKDSKDLPTIECVKVRDPRRFHFEVDSRGNLFLKLRTRNNFHNGIYVPARKFIVHRYHAIPDDDPYGNGVGRFLYYPVQWKRELLTLWLTIVDKYSDPTAIGTYDESVSQEDKEEFDRAIKNISRDMAISMPNTFSLDFLSPSLSSVDVLSELEKICNTYISKVISGESNTGERGSEGSTKQTVSDSIRIMKAKGLSDLISETLNNTLIKWLVKFRYPEANPPKLWRNFKDIDSQIDLLNRIKSLGFNTTVEYVQNLTGVTLETRSKSGNSKSFGMAE